MRKYICALFLLIALSSFCGPSFDPILIVDVEEIEDRMDAILLLDRNSGTFSAHYIHREICISADRMSRFPTLPLHLAQELFPQYRLDWDHYDILIESILD